MCSESFYIVFTNHLQLQADAIQGRSKDIAKEDTTCFDMKTKPTLSERYI